MMYFFLSLTSLIYSSLGVVIYNNVIVVTATTRLKMRPHDATRGQLGVTRQLPIDGSEAICCVNLNLLPTF